MRTREATGVLEGKLRWCETDGVNYKDNNIINNNNIDDDDDKNNSSVNQL